MHKTQSSDDSIDHIDTQINKNLTTILKGVKIDIVGRIVNTGLRYFYVFLLARLLGANSMGI